MWLEIHGLNLRNHKKMEKIQQNMTEGVIREKTLIYVPPLISVYLLNWIHVHDNIYIWVLVAIEV